VPALLRRGAGYLVRHLTRLALPALGTVRGVRTAERVAALTFDDGPHPEWTPRLLDILAARGAKATFFVVGEAVRAHPELTARIRDEGHALGNHTWDHRSLPTLGRRERRAQLERCREALAPYGGDARLFRPPFGDQTLASLLTARRLGYTVVTWSHAAGDWLPRSAADLQADLARKLAPGVIILLHDALYRTPDPGSSDRSAVLGAVAGLLAARPDYAFVTVPTLLGGATLKRSLRRTLWFKPPDAAWLAHVGGLPEGSRGYHHEDRHEDRQA
jgi:peptidoglycan-N-acetylglucosamine deacetylase